MGVRPHNPARAERASTYIVIGYEVTDTATGRVMRTYEGAHKLRSAQAYADRLDGHYGCVRYAVHTVWSDPLPAGAAARAAMARLALLAA